MARYITRGNGRDAKERRERKYRLRGTVTRFIPDGDGDFAHMGRMFANHIARHAARFGLSAEQIERVSSAVDAFRMALAKTERSDTCGPMATRNKNDARAAAEKEIRAARRILDAVAHDSINDADRLMLNMHQRPKRLKRRECPNVAPVLWFKGSPSGADGTAAQKHTLEYGNDFDRRSSAKPRGAARLELFVELVPPEWHHEKKIPARPEQLTGRPWYLGSFTTSRFEVEFPVLSDGTPMLVVYWGRWADATGGVGPFSRTCIARVEGGAPGLLPALPMYIGKRPEIAAKMNRVIEAKQLEYAQQYLGAGAHLHPGVVFEKPRALPEGLESDETADAAKVSSLH